MVLFYFLIVLKYTHAHIFFLFTKYEIKHITTHTHIINIRFLYHLQKQQNILLCWFFFFFTAIHNFLALVFPLLVVDIVHVLSLINFPLLVFYLLVLLSFLNIFQKLLLHFWYETVLVP